MIATTYLSNREWKEVKLRCQLLRIKPSQYFKKLILEDLKKPLPREAFNNLFNKEGGVGELKDVTHDPHHAVLTISH